MLIALGENGREKASPNRRAACPVCGSSVISKCGEIVTWHWAHESGQDCDSWSEGETAWHTNWKNQFPDDWQEIVIGCHRADIQTPECVVEFQQSPISSREIREREDFYGDMVWVVDGSGFQKNMIFRNRGKFVSFRWKWPRKSWWHAQCDVIFDMPKGLFHVQKIYRNKPCGGWGNWISMVDFMLLVGL